MKMYYRITSSSPLSNFEATTRYKPILHSTGLTFFCSQFFTYLHCYLEVKLNFASYLQVIPFFFQ